MSAHAASSKDLFVLGRLSMRPTHGHEIMRTLAQSQADLWAELSDKHVYYILKKFERDGLVEVEEQRTGNRPVRKTYSLTPTGSMEFERLMRSDVFVESNNHSDFDVVFGMLAYTSRLSPEEKNEILLRRAAHLRALIADADEAAERAVPPGAAGLPARVFEKVSRVASAELTWLEEVIAYVSSNGWEDARGDAASQPTR
jgi:DNA-binding PadR family transcriptional regulator